MLERNKKWEHVDKFGEGFLPVLRSANIRELKYVLKI